MDKASAYGAGDCRFESYQGQRTPRPVLLCSKGQLATPTPTAPLPLARPRHWPSAPSGVPSRARGGLPHRRFQAASCTSISVKRRANLGVGAVRARGLSPRRPGFGLRGLGWGVGVWGVGFGCGFQVWAVGVGSEGLKSRGEVQGLGCGGAMVVFGVGSRGGGVWGRGWCWCLGPGGWGLTPFRHKVGQSWARAVWPEPGALEPQKGSGLPARCRQPDLGQGTGLARSRAGRPVSQPRDHIV